jgi:hypothetical protein
LIAEIKLRAERKAGELLPEAIQRGGDAKTRHGFLGALGIDDHQSIRWQLEARLGELLKDQGFGLHGGDRRSTSMMAVELADFGATRARYPEPRSRTEATG